MKKFKARPYADKTKPKLKFVVNFKQAGKRSRQFFESKTKADTFASLKNIELENGGIEASQFPSNLRIMASQGADRLKPFGKTIDDAVAFYLPHLEAMNRTCTFANLIIELSAMKEKDGASDRYLGDLSSRLGQFSDAFPEVQRIFGPRVV